MSISDLWKTRECEVTIDPEGRVSIAFSGDPNHEDVWITLTPDGKAIEQQWIDGAGVITEKEVDLRDAIIRLIHEWDN